ncbi:MAG: FHA domain-containing protein, partial [Acidobacteria bacterium]|nr:FHA domain-containing protein [Acidobacteriota bacterium]
MSAHAVGDGNNAELGLPQRRILVDRAHRTRMRARAHSQHRNGSVRKPAAPAMIPAFHDCADSCMFVLIINQRGAPHEYRLCEGHTVVGRGLHCDVVINDESISRQHARLVVRAGQVELNDLQSRNGTYVGGHAVREATLRGGEPLSFGDVEATIEQRSDAPEAALGALVAEHTMFRRLGDTATATSVAQVVEAPRLIKLLSEVARTLVATLPLRDILNRVIDLLLAHVPAERACLALAQPGTQTLASQIVRRADGMPSAPVEISRTVRQMTLSQRVAVLTSDVHEDPRFDGSQSVLLSNVRSLICG